MAKNTKLINLIKSLVTSFKDYDDNLKNRFKVDSIMLGFEEDTDRNLNKLINLSESRHKYVKFGVNIDNILKRQKSKYENLNNKIKNDKLYSSNLLNLEKSKLFKSVVTYKNKEIFDIRDKLVNTLKSNKNVFLKHNESNQNIKEKKKSEPKIPKINISNDINNSYIPVHSRKMSDISNFNIFSRRATVTSKKITNNNNEGQKLLDNLMEKDYNNFFATINSYHTFLDKLKNISNERYNGKGIKISKDNFAHIQSNLSPESLNFLTYNDNKNNLKVENPLEKDLEFDLKTLQKIKLIHDKINNKTLKNKISNINNNENNHSYSSKTNLEKNKGLTLDINSNSNIDKDLDNIIFPKLNTLRSRRNKNNNEFNNKKSYNYKNTSNIVLNETENGLYNTQNFINKRKIFNSYFNKCFNHNIKKNKKNLSCNNNKHLKEIKNDYLRKTLPIKKEIFEYGQKNKEKIRKEFQDIYEQKKLQWKNEENQKKLKKTKENEEMKEIEYFLLNIQNKNLSKNKKNK